MFQKALGFIKTVLGSTGLISPLLALFGVAIPPIALAAVPAAIGLMTAVEDAMGDGTGPLKKAAVKAGLSEIATGMQAVSTGGQKETWQNITPETIDTMIDVLAALANGIAKGTGHDAVFDDSEWEKIKGGQG